MSQETTNSQTILTNILPKVAQSSKAMASDSPQSFSILTSSLSSGNVQTYSQPEQLKQQMNEERERRRKRAERFQVNFIEPKKTDLVFQQTIGYEGLASGKEMHLPKSKKFSISSDISNVPTNENTSANPSRDQKEVSSAFTTSNIKNKVLHQELVPLVFEEEPIPFDPTVKLRPEVLYVCNTERLERNVLFTYFALYNVQSIERLSKTSCNVIFPNPEVVKRVLDECGEPIVFNNEVGVWFRARGRFNKGLALFRIATSRDLPTFTSKNEEAMPHHQQRGIISERGGGRERGRGRGRREGRRDVPLNQSLQKSRIQKGPRSVTRRQLEAERERFELDIRQLKNIDNERLQQRIQRFVIHSQLQQPQNTTSTSTSISSQTHIISSNSDNNTQ